MSSALDFGLAPGDTVIAGAPAAWRLTAFRDPAEGDIHLTRWSWNSLSAEWCHVSDLVKHGGGDFHLSVREQRALVAFLAPPTGKACESEARIIAVLDDYGISAHDEDWRARLVGDLLAVSTLGVSLHEKCPACHASRCRPIAGRWLCKSCKRVWSRSQIDAFYAGTLCIDPLESAPPTADPLEQLRLDAGTVHDRVSHAMRRHGAR